MESLHLTSTQLFKTAFVPTVVFQHAEETAMLWVLRQSAVAAPHYGLADLAKLDGRIEAHLDGLRIAGDEGWKACEEQLAANEAGEVFAAAITAYESGKQERIDKVVAVVEQEPALGVGLASALGWFAFEQAEAPMLALLRSKDGLRQRVGLEAAAIHRRHPGIILSRSVRANDPALRARTLKSIGELRDQTLARAVGDALSDADPECCFEAAWAGALLGLPQAVQVLQQFAESVPNRSAAAAGMAVRRMALADALSWQKHLASESKLIRAGITAAGAIGDSSLVPWLIFLMSELPVARIAGEAFTLITGVDLAYRDLERKPPEDFNAGPTEDPKDENVAMDPDDNLPWPHPALVQKWWQANEAKFPKGVRHLMGKPIAIEWLEQVLRGGRQRQRAAAAVELAMLKPGEILINVSDPGFRQQQTLGRAEVIR